jgi:hypothetical protein
MRTLAEARPRRLDPDPGSVPPDAASIMAQYSDTTTTVRPTRTRRRLVLAGLVPTVGLLAAAAVVIVVAPQSAQAPPSATGPNGTEASVPAPSTARDYLLVAAQKQATTTPVPASGRYWVTTRMYDTIHAVAGGSYHVTTHERDETWDAASAADQSRAYRQYLGATPTTTADEAAWRANGSPTSWGAIQAAAEPLYETPAYGTTPGRAFNVNGRPMTLAELRALPSEPAALRTAINGSGMVTGPNAEFEILSSLVLFLPTSPRVRAAAYQLLADLDGVTLVNTGVTDRLGRAGVAVSQVYRNGDIWWETVLVFDPHTGQALAQQHWNRGTGASPATSRALAQSFLYQNVGWSNATPPTNIPTEPTRR